MFRLIPDCRKGYPQNFNRQGMFCGRSTFAAGACSILATVDLTRALKDDMASAMLLRNMDTLFGE
jgi:hypothetical protein